jgi:hypothetical protein
MSIGTWRRNRFLSSAKAEAALSVVGRLRE